MKARFVSLLAVLALALLAVPATGSAANSVTFSDPTGDSGPGPDISSVTIANDDAGTISFRIEIPNRQTPSAGFFLVVSIDSDLNPATGRPDIGDEYEARANNQGTAFFRWNGSTYEQVPVSMNQNFVAGVLTFNVRQSDLGGPAAFNFRIGVLDNPDDSSNFDSVPDSGPASYSLTAGAAPTAPTTITKLLIPLTVFRPVAGKIYSARVVLLKLDSGIVKPEKTTCRLTVKGTTLKPLAGGCKWKLSKKLADKKLVLKMTFSYKGASEKKTLPVKVLKR